MKSKSTKKKSKVSSGGDNAVQQFLLWHSEKIVVGIVVVVALWFAMKGLGYQTLSWQPSELERVAGEAETAIRNNVRTAENEEIQIFDYAEFAKQIRVPVSSAPYRSESAWLPALGSTRPSAPSAQE